MSDAMMKKLAQKDPSSVNSSYILSVFLEDNFKELLD
jgi:hypothetical protein